MITNVNDLKDLIIWAKSQKLKSLKLADVTFEFSELAHIEDIQSQPNIPQFTSVETMDIANPPKSARLPDGNAQRSEDDEVLFWSAT
jgi:hypothetical protein